MIDKDREQTKEMPEGGSTIPSDSDLILSSDNLLPGDVLLYRSSKPGVVGRSISAATDSPYTHAAIYVGDGFIADSIPPKGVSKSLLADTLQGIRCVAVLRSQYGFGADRQSTLVKFVDAVLENRLFYDFKGIGKFRKHSADYFNNQLEFIRKNYGKFTTPDEFSKQRFFCSAFVVACYAVVGIIDECAQVAYQPESFSPGHLYRNPTFGWLLGYLVPEGGTVPSDDPALETTLWRDL